MWRVAKSHHLLTLDLAERAANETEHKEERGDPHGSDGVEIISHGPDESGVPHGGCSHRFRADAVVLGEQEASSCDQDRELEQADEVGEVDGADSPSVSPGADEHSESVEGDEEVARAVEDLEGERGRRGGGLGEENGLVLGIDVHVVDDVDEELVDQVGGGSLS